MMERASPTRRGLGWLNGLGRAMGLVKRSIALTTQAKAEEPPPQGDASNLTATPKAWSYFHGPAFTKSKRALRKRERTRRRLGGNGGR